MLHFITPLVFLSGDDDHAIDGGPIMVDHQESRNTCMLYGVVKMNKQKINICSLFWDKFCITLPRECEQADIVVPQEDAVGSGPNSYCNIHLHLKRLLFILRHYQRRSNIVAKKLSRHTSQFQFACSNELECLFMNC